MTDYKDILNGAIGKLADRVKETAGSSGVRDMYAQGTSRARALGQVARLTLELGREKEALDDVYTELGRLYFEQAGDSPTGAFIPLCDKARRIHEKMQEKLDKIDELKASSGVTGIDVEIGDFEDVVSATEADGMTVEIKKEE